MISANNSLTRDILSKETCRVHSPQRALTNILIWALVLLIGARFHPSAAPSAVNVFWADAVIFLLALWILAVQQRFKIPAWYIQLFLWTLGLIVFLGTLSLASFVIAQNDPIPTFINFLRYGFYGFCFLFFVLILQGVFDGKEDRIAERALKWLDVLFLVNLAVALMQLFDPPIFGDLVKALYGSEKLRSIWTGYPRVYGAFYNANWFGIFLTCSTTAWISAWMVRLKSFHWAMLRVLLALGLLLVAGSRTGFIGLFGGGLVIIFQSQRPKVAIGLLAVSLGFSALLPIISDQFPLMARTLERFSVLFTTDDTIERLAGDGSVAGRTQSWDIAFNAFKEKPLLGYGDNSLGSGIIPHNGYLSLLLAYGVVGSTVILLWLGIVVWTIGRPKKRSQSQLWIYGWFCSFSVAFAIMNLAGDFVNATQLMLLWLLILALAIVTMKQRSSRNQNAGKREGESDSTISATPGRVF